MDKNDPFGVGDIFGSNPFAKERADVFEKFASEFGPLFSSEPPEPKKCATKLELANWFSQFARACRANLPKKEADGS